MFRQLDQKCQAKPMAQQTDKIHYQTKTTVKIEYEQIRSGISYPNTNLSSDP